VIAINQASNGYSAERDMRVMPNGHALFTIVDSTIMDLSTLVPGGYPAAKISHNVIQEIDVDNNVVFQWSTLDSGSAVFTDDTATNYPTRFYRIRVP